MTVEVRRGGGHTFRLRPAQPMVDPSAAVYDRYGALLESPSATSDSVSTTVASDAGNTRDTFLLTSPVGVSRGRWYTVSDPTWGAAACQVSSVDGSTVRTVDPLPGIPDAGSAFEGIEVSVSITSASSPRVDTGYLVVVSDADTDQEVTASYDVAVHPYRGPVTADLVRSLYARIRPGDRARLQDEQSHANIADRCNQQLQARLRAADRYLSRYWSESAFDEPGRLLVYLALAEEQVFPPGRNPDDYIQGLRFELRDRIAEILTSTQTYDADGDGDVDDVEVIGSHTAYIGRTPRSW